MTTCAFTGHRLLPDDFDKSLLERKITELIEEGADEFLCGMAVGFDMLCAETVIKLKKKFDIKLVACIPCDGQSNYYSSRDKLRYDEILRNCDEKKVLSPYYFNGCMQARDRYMVERADLIFCYLTRKSGGTYYTVNYAKSSEKRIKYF